MLKKNIIFQLRSAFLMIEAPFFVAELQPSWLKSGKAGDLRGALLWLRQASELGALGALEGGEATEATFLALLMGCDAWSFWVGVGGFLAIDHLGNLPGSPINQVILVISHSSMMFYGYIPPFINPKQ